ncbi:hypothetical protein V6N12_045443 [Hibiscus sabdariffa]|uniref:Uncharacterized protein n=1 Tax=Hibiscus sabdariffa TaxID=183260 RepID=A0ABR2G2S8_9ROSI
MPEVVVLRVLHGVGNHVAVLIVELDATTMGDSRVRGGSSVGYGGWFGKENINKGLQIHKNWELRALGKAVLTDWVDPNNVNEAVEMIEDDPSDTSIQEPPDDLVVLGSSMDAILSMGGGVLSSQ